MKYKHIDGDIFRLMAENGLRNLKNNEKKINAMNVFPVSDGDTGTNMRLSLENALAKAKPTKSLGNYLKEFSAGMLLGARGNSGVILSQLFKGFTEYLSRCSIANPKEIEAALIKAYQKAYQAVDHPVEGTILTVAREGIENIKGQFGRGSYVNDVYSLYLSEMRKSLKTLPTLLPVLEEAGVDDSGALGYILIVEGMVKALYEENIPLLDEEDGKLISNPAKVDSSFDHASKFELGYCQEFLLQLLDSHTKINPFNLDSFTKALRQLGESLIVIKEGDIIKIHIHTLKPSKVMEEAQRYGEFISFKLDNLDYQHANLKQDHHCKMLLGPNSIHHDEKLSIIVSGGGEKMSQMLIDSGASLAIVKENGVSIEEYIASFNKVIGERVLILPGNANNLSSAEAAANLYKDKRVDILPTDSVIESYYALTYGTADILDYEDRYKAMEEGKSLPITLYLAIASRDYSDGKINIKKGDFIGLKGKTPLVSGSNLYDCLISLIKTDENLDDRCCAFLLKGKDIEVNEDKLTSLFEEQLPSLSFEAFEGGQSLYALIVGLI